MLGDHVRKNAHTKNTIRYLRNIFAKYFLVCYNDFEIVKEITVVKIEWLNTLWNILDVLFVSAPHDVRDIYGLAKMPGTTPVICYVKD